MEKIKVYTDGGCTGNPGPGGWAFVLVEKNGHEPFSGGEVNTTNNRMELSAVIKALGYLLKNRTERDIELYTDSQYVKNGLTQWIHNWIRNGWKTANKKPVKNKELWMELHQLAGNFNIDWHWVKGHSGNQYNEMCDSLVADERAVFEKV